MKQFKIRCSAIGLIMAGAAGITDNQKARIVELSEKKEAGKITDKQTEELNGLIYKRDNPELSEGAKTYCHTWIKEQLYERKQEFSSKYTEKGTTVENDAIDFVAEQLGWGLVSKNEHQFEDEHMTGTPDVLLADEVPDIKSSWSCWSFPLFNSSCPDKIYDWQLQGYMALTGKKRASVHYCLMDAPLTLVESEARKIAFRSGETEVSVELYDEVMLDMNYSHLPAELRLKSFYFDRDENAIQLIRNRVELCRKYIESLNITEYSNGYSSAALRN